MADIRDRVIEVRKMRLGDCVPNEKNWRKHPAGQRDGYKSIAEKIGFAGTLLARVTEDGRVNLIDGHMRQGTHPDLVAHVAITDLSEAEANAILATFDPLAGLAETDNAALEQLLREVDSSFGDLDGLLAEIAHQYAVALDEAQPVGDPGAQLDRATELREQWGVERGMIWQIGRHRLMCGDSYSEQDRARLLNGEKAAMLHTDPPYGINIVKPKNGSDRLAYGESKPFGSSNGEKRLPPGKARRDGSTGRTDRTRAAFSGARDTEPVSRAATPNSTWIDGGPRGAVRGPSRTAIVIQSNTYPVIEGDDRPFDPAAFLNVAPITILWGANYFADKLPISACWICWDKREGITRNDFADCEMAWCNLNKPARVFHHLWNGLHKGSQHGERRTHPTEKPVALFAEIGKFFCPEGVWMDLFSGSGAQLVAAEQVGEAVKGYGMEIEPLYVATTLQRLKDMGLTPEVWSGQ